VCLWCDNQANIQNYPDQIIVAGGKIGLSSQCCSLTVPASSHPISRTNIQKYPILPYRFIAEVVTTKLLHAIQLRARILWRNRFRTYQFSRDLIITRHIVTDLHALLVQVTVKYTQMLTSVLGVHMALLLERRCLCLSTTSTCQ